MTAMPQLPTISRHVDATLNPCPLTAREDPYLLTCCLPAGHTGMCMCNNIIQIDEEER